MPWITKDKKIQGSTFLGKGNGSVFFRTKKGLYSNITWRKDRQLTVQLQRHVDQQIETSNFHQTPRFAVERNFIVARQFMSTYGRPYRWSYSKTGFRSDRSLRDRRFLAMGCCRLYFVFTFPLHRNTIYFQKFLN